MLSLALVAPQTAPPGAISPANRQLSRPGDSRSRSRSLTSVPPPPAMSGGSGQARATRSEPIDTPRPPPGRTVVVGELTTKVCDTVVFVVLLIGGSPVPMSSQISSPDAGYSGA